MASERGPDGDREAERGHSQVRRGRAKTREAAAGEDSGLTKESFLAPDVKTRKGA